MHTKTYFPLILASILWGTGYSQGCSDAGFCTLNSFKPHKAGEAYNNQLKTGISYGQADFSITVLSFYVEYSRQFSEKFSADLKLTSLAQSGNSISAFNTSDVYLNTNYRTSTNIRFTLGAKIPLNNANRKENNLPLPMDYQSSLGTVDLLAGVGFSVQKVQLVFAWQQPLTQNQNTFLADDYPSTSALSRFPSTNQFKRSGDVLVRVSYPFRLSDKVQFTTSVLPIYHLANDTFINEQGIETEIEGSEGLTLNFNAFLDYQLSEKSALQLNVGFPTVVRDTRPDGLTRSFIATVEYRIRF